MIDCSQIGVIRILRIVNGYLSNDTILIESLHFPISRISSHLIDAPI